MLESGHFMRESGHSMRQSGHSMWESGHSMREYGHYAGILPQSSTNLPLVLQRHSGRNIGAIPLPLPTWTEVNVAIITGDKHNC